LASTVESAEHAEDPSAAEQGADVEVQPLVDELLVGPGQDPAPVGGRRPVLERADHDAFSSVFG
jgi:hypothetical protein